jgi:hypothetical protein
MPKTDWTRRRALLAGAAALAAPAAGAQQAPRDAEGGIGGTGIVGVLTDFGSLIVAGARIAQGPRTRYANAFGRMAAGDLAIGHSLTVEAARADGGLVARRVQVDYPLIGSVSALAARGFVVNGIEVIWRGRRSVATGDRVAVSGLWRGSAVVASRVDPAPASAGDLIAGDVARDRVGGRIGGVTVRGRGLAQVADGNYAACLGRFETTDSRFQAENVAPGRFTGAAGPLRHLKVEGFLDPTDRAPGYRLAGLGHSFERNLLLEPFADARMLFEGAYTGRFAADRATRLPDARAARHALLLSLSTRDG